ncbi:MAG: peptide chain release factor N(5)-glutamine methyltransferase [Bacteroidetes bacterium]|nr:peptide chain release factor N(5)-glutamine methyltransferase [Bacteroidota bacterium]
MNSLKNVFQTFRQDLANLYDIKETDSLSRIALEEVTGFSSSKIKAFPELELSESQAKAIQKILTELKTGKPIQYILGHTEFYGLTFKVNPSVLIPRPETEELVTWIVSSVGSKQLAVGSILDVGTGSGCIAVSLKKNLPEFEVSAIDISESALQTAKENAELNKTEIHFVQADILNLKSEIEHSKRRSPLEHLEKTNKGEKFNLIVSNPPYVTLADKQQMHTNVTNFEPHTALFVPENDPLIFYKAIADFASGHLEKDGLLFFEINENYGEQIVELLNSKSFNNIELRKDLSSRNRMIRAIR